MSQKAGRERRAPHIYLVNLLDHNETLFQVSAFVAELPTLDVAVIGVMPERNNIENYTPRLMRVWSNPPVVIPTHWDRFNVSYSVSQEPAVRRLQSFLDEVKSVSPATRIIVPEYFKPIILE